MSPEDYASQDATGLAGLVRRGEVTPDELARLALEAIATVNPRINCVIDCFIERAEGLPVRPDGPLGGVPYLGKDLPFEKGVKAEMGSQLAQGYVCTEDTELAIRLRRAGAVNLGRTTTSEFALAAATENRLTGRTCNPWNPDRSVAGSSGGAAASVASGIVPFAQGSDAGGSIRMPASFCGLVGLKPTRARVPLAPAPTLAYAGLNNVFVLTRSVRDCAAVLDAVEGPARGDAVEIPRPARPYCSEIERVHGPLRIGFTDEAWSGLTVDRDVAEAVRRTAVLCESLGHHVEEAAPAFDYEPYIAAQKVLWQSFTAHDIAAVARELGRTPGLDNLQTTTWNCYRRGMALEAGALMAALDVYNEITRAVGAFWDHYDILLTPTCTIAPRPLGTFDPDGEGADLFDQLGAHETFTALFNATGQPAISLPLEESDDGMPVGMQFVGRFGDEATLLRLAVELEQARPWALRRPAVHVANLTG